MRRIWGWFGALSALALPGVTWGQVDPLDEPFQSRRDDIYQYTIRVCSTGDPAAWDELWRLAEEEDWPEAWYEISTILIGWPGCTTIPMDRVTGLEALRIAANGGWPLAEHEYGYKLFYGSEPDVFGQNVEAGLEYLQRASRGGFGLSDLILAEIIARGDAGVALDLELFEYHYDKAVAEGMVSLKPERMANLATWLDEMRDPAQVALSQNTIDAMRGLDQSYLDRAAAVYQSTYRLCAMGDLAAWDRLNALAEAEGRGEAWYEISLILRGRQSCPQIEEDPLAGVLALRNSAEAGWPLGEYSYGYLRFFGDETEILPHDFDLGVEYLARASDQGMGLADMILAEIVAGSAKGAVFDIGVLEHYHDQALARGMTTRYPDRMDQLAQIIMNHYIYDAPQDGPLELVDLESLSNGNTPTPSAEQQAAFEELYYGR